MEIIFTINGPGELYGLSFPLIKKIRERMPEVVITVFMIPCQFSSGMELVTAQESKLFDNIISVPEYKKWLLTKKYPDDYSPQPEGIVFFLGGDAVHALTIAKRLGREAYAYDEGNLRQKSKFKKLFLPELDGNLMVDAARDRQISYANNPIGSPSLKVGFYPGSRIGHIDLMIPLFIKVEKILRAKHPGMNFVWGVNENLKSYFEKKYPKDEVPFKYEEKGTAYDLIVSLTGTNTAISAVWGIPLVVLLPFNKPSLVPFMGLFGLISNIPLIGTLLKYLALHYVSKTHSFISIPNIKAKREVIPELVGFLKAEQIAAVAEDLLVNISKREEIHKTLPIIMGKPGADNIVNKMEKILRCE